MSIEKAYNIWAATYDSNLNKTRDLDEIVTKKILNKPSYGHILELGCGTGKNTQWLIKKCDSLTAFDFSEEMLEIAKQKISSKNVTFKQQDFTQNWNLTPNSIDLITCNLVLEHIRDLNLIFKKASEVLKDNGQFYICELHPFKQYSGSKAKFNDGTTIQELEVYTHHITDYTDAAIQNGFDLLQIKECFDLNKNEGVPRLINFIFSKKQ